MIHCDQGKKDLTNGLNKEEGGPLQVASSTEQSHWKSR